jgi:hypothetical protein
MLALTSTHSRRAARHFFCAVDLIVTELEYVTPCAGCAKQHLLG